MCTVWLMDKGNTPLNTLRTRQNGRRFADDTFKRVFLNENAVISIEISMKFVPKGPINNNPALVQIMAWRRSGDKPLSEPMMVSLLTHICVTRPQWVLIDHSITNYNFQTTRTSFGVDDYKSDPCLKYTLKLNNRCYQYSQNYLCQMLS